MEGVNRTHLAAVLYRAVYLPYSGDPLPSRSAMGRFHGSAWTTSYLTMKQTTAWKEVIARWPADIHAYRMVDVEVTVRNILDLTDPDNQASHGVTVDILTAGDHVPCRRLANSLRGQHFEGLWTFSAVDRPDGRVLALFLDQLQPDSSVRVVAVRAVEL